MENELITNGTILVSRTPREFFVSALPSLLILIVGVFGLLFFAVGLFRIFMNKDNKQQRKRGKILLIVGTILSIPLIVLYFSEM